MVASSNTTSIPHVKLDNLHYLTPEHDRLNWYADERADMPLSKELVASIVDRGVLTPVRVVAIPDQPGHYMVADGRQRVRAAAKAGLDAVPVVVVDDASDFNAAALDNLAANVHVSDPPNVRHAKVERLLASGIKRKEIARAAGVSEQRVGQWLAWGKMTEATRAAVLKGELSFDAALKRLQGDGKPAKASKDEAPEGKGDKAPKAAKAPEGPSKTEALVEAVAALLATLAVGDVPAGTARLAYKAVAEAHSALTE